MTCDRIHFQIFFLLDEDCEDLEQDLKVGKKIKNVHLRFILKEHAKLKMRKISEPDARATPAGTPVAHEVTQLIPCAS